jgi:8-oxo-dGTP pyrophosphatase MutT (NUDIX family)
VFTTRSTGCLRVHRSLRPEVCVEDGLFRDGQLLLLKRAPTLSALLETWDMPGGDVETGETLLLAHRREIREETGVRMKVNRALWSELLDILLAKGASPLHRGGLLLLGPIERTSHSGSSGTH